MLTFVKRATLQTENADNPVQVVATYSNEKVLPLEYHGDTCTLLTLADNLVQIRQFGIMTLVPTWRDDYQPVVNAEAARRINLVFPQYKQMNSTAQYNQYQAQYGVDTSTWPADATAFLAEYERGWNYVKAVRTVSNSFGGMPTDPTDDSLWPTPISPVNF